MVIDGRERGSLLGRLKSDGEWCVRDVWLWCMSVCCVLCACCAARYLPPVWSGCESVGEEMISIEICLMYWFLRIEISIRYVYIFWKNWSSSYSGEYSALWLRWPGFDSRTGHRTWTQEEILFFNHSCTFYALCDKNFRLLYFTTYLPPIHVFFPSQQVLTYYLTIYLITSLVNSNGRTATTRLWHSSLSLIQLRYQSFFNHLLVIFISTIPFDFYILGPSPTVMFLLQDALWDSAPCLCLLDNVSPSSKMAQFGSKSDNKASLCPPRLIPGAW